MLTRCTRLPVPNCSDNQGRSHVHEATKNVRKRQYEEECDSKISSLKVKFYFIQIYHGYSVTFFKHLTFLRKYCKHMKGIEYDVIKTHIFTFIKS